MSQADIEAQRKALDAVLKNQIEIMGSLSLLLRYVKPDLVGNAGELDIQRAELLDRHKATQAALRQAAKELHKHTPDEKAPWRCAECGGSIVAHVKEPQR